ncbi:MAG: RluA family pseudouridine synthase [Vicinamibacterales bacterium]
MPLPPRTVVADRGDAGRRIDLVVRRHLTDLARATRTRVQSWIEGGRVSVNGLVVRRASARAALDDVIVVELPDEQPRAEVRPEPGALERLFEDEHFLIVSKPAGVVSHPTFRHPEGSLLNVVLWHAREWPRGQRPSLVGRLDKLTSGAIAIAKTTTAHARLQRTLLSSFAEKSYLAVVYGPVDRERGTIDLRLRRHPDDRRRVIATKDDGLESLTRFQRIAESTIAGCPVALVRCQIITGRMHQVRVHMAASGWPLIGDPKYGEPRWQDAAEGIDRDYLRDFPRQALHAWRLAFVHPFTSERVEVEASIPEDLNELLRRCGLSALPTSAL